MGTWKQEAQVKVAKCHSPKLHQESPELATATMRVTESVAEALLAIDGVKPHGYGWPPPAEDQIRLLNLEVWARRYAVSLEFVMSTLIDWFGRMRKKRETGGLGLTVASITGAAARQVVAATVEAAYPGKENYRCRDLDLKAKIGTTIPSPDLEDLDPDDFVTAYKRRIKMARRKLEDKTLARRPWRGNPWTS